MAGSPRNTQRHGWGTAVAALRPVTVAALMAMTPMASAAEEGGGVPVGIVARAIEHHGGDRYRHSESSLELCSRSGCYRISVQTDGGRYEQEVSGPYRGATRTRERC